MFSKWQSPKSETIMPRKNSNTPGAEFAAGIWSEGAIYISGFDPGLSLWKRFLKSNRWIAITDLSWLDARLSQEARSFWTNDYPGIRSVPENIGALEKAGFQSVRPFFAAGRGLL